MPLLKKHTNHWKIYQTFRILMKLILWDNWIIWSKNRRDFSIINRRLRCYLKFIYLYDLINFLSSKKFY